MNCKSSYRERSVGWFSPRQLSLTARRPLDDDDDGVSRPDEQQQDQEVGEDPLGYDLPVFGLKSVLWVFICSVLFWTSDHTRIQNLISAKKQQTKTEPKK